ncbi:MAG: serine O-acetyltransferase EpsC [Candidatus Caenarcaniphilales bacterium]|nr:serine O-acetyltransferase EpsC [Candidatus Caenarcaniphilales bacterium]
MGALRELLDFVRENDPAAKSWLEVLCCYPGLHAVCFHRLGSWFYERRLFLIARLISQFARWLTGIEIHPGARIGHPVFIDHGMGVVIGETAIVGNRVIMYHGVTLGGISLKPIKRHPTIEDDVIIGAHCQIIGDVRIGKGAILGAGSVVVKDVIPGITVAGIPAREIRS